MLEVVWFDTFQLPKELGKLEEDTLSMDVGVTLLKSLWGTFLSWMGVKRDREREHDLGIFNKLNAIADEPKIDDILNGAIFTSHLTLDEIHVIEELLDSLVRIENRYLDSKIQLKAEVLEFEMTRLLSLVRQTFFTVPLGHLKFYPDPIDPQVYDEERSKLIDSIDQAWDSYKNYRSTVKERLLV